jgi:HEPN domain-containing protein
MDEKVKYWVELAEYDLETAKAMLKSKRYLYVGFNCHQTIENVRYLKKQVRFIYGQNRSYNKGEGIKAID